MFCTECGEKNLAESNFCKRCGHKTEPLSEKSASGKVSEEAYIRALPDDERVTALLERAYSLKASGDAVGAIKACEEAISITPDSASAHSLLGQLHASQGNVEPAIRAYEAALALNPGDIADRMKLDELKRGDLPILNHANLKSTLPLSSAPLIVERTTFSSPLVPALLGLTVLLLGGICIALWRDTGQKTVPVVVANTGNSPSTNQERPIIPNSVFTPTLPPNVPAKEQVTGNNKPETQHPNQGAENKVKENAQPSMPDASPTRNPTPSTRTPLPPKVKAEVRVREKLDGGENVTGTSADTMKIVIDASQGNQARRTEKPNKSNNNPAAKTNSNDHIVVVEANEGNKTFGGNNTRSARLIADDLKLKGDYTRAIPQYQKALSGAGDESGYLYQQIGYCYQRRGDKAAAKSNYERAAGEYRRQLASGRQPEDAKNGLRSVETSLKLCE